MSINTLKMAEPDCFASNHSLTANMDHEQQDKKDISKLFAVLRSKLNAKEKELLELQRAQPCLLAPDAEQIDALVNAISSLQLATQDGCFLFPATTSNGSSATCACPSGVDTIKTLPSTIWLPNLPAPVTDNTQTNDHRLPMVSHLLSLPVSAYVASSSSLSSPSDHPPVPVQAKPEPCHRLPMVSQLLAMPINAFRSPSTVISQPTPVPVEVKKEAKSNTKDNGSVAESTKSIFLAEPTYSKEHWLRRTSSSSDSDYEHIPLDLDAYIEQSSSKMRRLHTEYLEAMAKLKSPAQAEDSAQAIKATYPQLFDRLQQEMNSRNPPHSSASQK